MKKAALAIAVESAKLDVEVKKMQLEKARQDSEFQRRESATIAYYRDQVNRMVAKHQELWEKVNDAESLRRHIVDLEKLFKDELNTQQKIWSADYNKLKAELESKSWLVRLAIKLTR